MRLGRALTAVCFLACVATGVALAKPQVTLHLTAFLLGQAQGRTTQVPLGSQALQAGDRVRFVIEARNDGTSPAVKLTPSDVIPAHMAYVPGSAKDGDATVEFTLDGKTWSAHPTVAVKTAKGVVKKPADPSQYKAIRWVSRVSLAAHHSFTYSFEAQVAGHKAGAK
jgi:uncharacterized repeat protein (TIGR01451 family)